MTGKLGVNLDFANPGGRPEPAALAGFRWARLVARPAPQFPEYVARLQAAGIRTMVVLAGESFGAGERAAQAATYAERIRPDCWQLGNEPDLRSPASWTMAPDEYGAFARECSSAIRRVQPNAWVISAGLASGRARWLRRCGPLPLDGIGLHAYGRRPRWFSPPPPLGLGTAPGLLRRYGRHGKPLWISEFGTNSALYQGWYLPRVYRALARRADVVAVCVFCYSDAMVPGFGLVDRDGHPKPVLDRLLEAARS